MRKNRSAKLYVLVLYFVFFFLLQVVYQLWISDMYAYSGFINEFDSQKFLISVFVLTCIFPVISVTNIPSDVFASFAIAMILIPSLVIYAGQSLPEQFLILTFGAVVTVIVSSKYFKIGCIASPSLPITYYTWFLAVVTVFTLVGILVFGGARFLNFDFSRVYDFRRDAARSMPGIFNFINPIVGKAVIPFGIVVSLLRKSRVFVLFFVVSSILLFGLTSHKGLVVYPFLTLFLYYMGSKQYKIVLSFTVALVFLMLGSGLDFWYQKSGSSFGDLGTLFARRAITVPAHLNGVYFEFFSNNDKYYWSHSKFSLGLFDSVDKLPPPKLIGEQYYNNDDMSANTGWIGSGYANAGYVGVFLYSILIGAFFSFLDSYAKLLGNTVVVSLFSVSAITMLSSTDLANMILTHGLFVMVILLVYFPKDIVAKLGILH